MPTELDFFRFIYKRQLIWYKRFILRNNPPWTSDPILKKYKIINMYRELDKCTIYIINKLNKTNDRKQILINIIFYRFFNLCNIYEDLEIEPFLDIEELFDNKLIEKLTLLQKTRPIFNNAYIISSGGRGLKHENILNVLRKLNFDKIIEELDNASSANESFEILTKIPMVGPFLACEIWTDLTYLNFFKQKWNDNNFVNIGPGAKWGLEILYGKLNKKNLNEKLELLYKLQYKMLSNIHIELGEELTWKTIAYDNAYSNYPFLSITNIEGALCEFRKYCRLSQGKGRRRYFKPLNS